MRRIKLVIQYDGTDYSGWQRQPGKNTIQGEIDKAISTLTDETIVTVGASRTDAGVHALGQTAHFDDSGKFDLTRYKHALNSILPDDIGIVSVEAVDPNFHARFDPVKKWYRYYIYKGDLKPVLQLRTSVAVAYSLNIEKMKEAAFMLEGKHDFTSFKTVTDQNLDQGAERTLFRCEVHKDGEMILFDIEGDGFLYKMVRALVGTLIEVGRGKEKPGWVKSVLEAQDRQKAGPNMPPQGLFLMEVFYKKG